MTPLERHCRWLLLAYPAGYRLARGEEMLGTLLEATPEGRDWPLARDCRAMITGGLRVRAAQNQRLSTPANLRLAATFGCVLYLSAFFSSYAGMGLWYLGARLGPATQSYPQVAFAIGLLACVAVLVVRPGGRKGAIARLVAVAALVAGTAAVVISDPAGAAIVEVVAALLVLALLAILASGGPRLPSLWLWPPGLIVAVALLAPVGSLLRFPQYFALLIIAPLGYVSIALAAVALAWIIIDARPAVGVAVFLGLTATVRVISAWLTFRILRSALPLIGLRNAMLAGTWSVAWQLLAAALVLALASAWRLRRQAML